RAAAPPEEKERVAVPPLERGRKIFLANCASCHGEKGDGKGPAAAAFPKKPTNFVEGPFRYGDSEENILESIANGRPPFMPAWAGIIKEEGRRALAAYIKSLRKKP
ncbi:MAG: c-type cytochrome, partial [Nitrospinota bacterium]